MHSESINELFESDVLFSLMKFRLVAKVTDLHVLHSIQSMLSSQCLYSFCVTWSVKTAISRSTTSKVIFDTFEQLKGPVPFELELSIEENMYIIKASTVPRRNKCLRVDCYLDENIVHRYE